MNEQAHGVYTQDNPPYISSVYVAKLLLQPHLKDGFVLRVYVENGVPAIYKVKAQPWGVLPPLTEYDKPLLVAEYLDTYGEYRFRKRAFHQTVIDFNEWGYTV
jgi:hypothetical protein